MHQEEVVEDSETHRAGVMHFSLMDILDEGDVVGRVPVSRVNDAVKLAGLLK